MQRLQKGFTLIELMIVLAVVAILVVIAIPKYQDYTRRTETQVAVTDMRNFSEQVKLSTQAPPN